MNIKPLEDRLIVKAEKQEKKSEGGIYLPGKTNESGPITAVVTAVGPGRTTDEGKVVPMHVAEGNKVLFNKHLADEVKIDGEEYYILHETEVLAIIG